MEHKQSRQKIDVAGILKAKNERLARIIPSFLVNGLKRLVHQDEINEILDKFGDISGLAFVNESLRYLGIQYNVTGLDNLPDEGRFMFISNHPLGGLDSLILIDIIGKKYPNIKIVVNDLLMNVEPLKELFVPINKHGRQTQSYAKNIDDSYKSDSQILYFPAGLCSRLQKGKIEDLEWKKSYLNQAIKYNRDIVPIHFEGKNSNLFYRLANIRKAIGIKFNYEMLMLPREMFLQRNATFEVNIGSPVKIEEIAAKRDNNFWNDFFRKQCYSLKNK